MWALTMQYLCDWLVIETQTDFDLPIIVISKEQCGTKYIV